jgi:hypothetical protein
MAVRKNLLKYSSRPANLPFEDERAGSIGSQLPAIGLQSKTKADSYRPITDSR